MRFASLGSGSRGNGTLVANGATTVLVDCGFSLRETERRLGRLGMDPARIDAILVTHEHGDHVGGVGALARRYGIAVLATAGTLAAAATDLGELPGPTRICPHTPFEFRDLRIEPLAVPHDAREPCQFVFGDGMHRLGVVTDVGSVTPYVCRRLDGCAALLLEFNHDAERLAGCPYPPAVKNRIAGDWGHLSNRQSAELLRAVETAGLKHLVAAHLSERNNTPALARAAAAEALGCAPDWVQIATQDAGLGWLEV